MNNNSLQSVNRNRRTLSQKKCDVAARKINVISPEDGAVVFQNNDNIHTFAANYLPWSSFAKLKEPHTEQYVPGFVRIEWEGEQDGEYVLQISESEDFAGGVVYVCHGTSFKLQNLFCGKKYYFRIGASGGYTSETRSFVTAREPRIIKIDGVSNTRDIGGYAVYENGNSNEKRTGYVKQGMVYRGANPDSVTESGQAEIERLGIKTILDLREKNNRKRAVKNVSYIELPPCGGPCYANGGMGVEEDKYRDSLVDEIRVLADEMNYPIYIHCQIGRDRTGTLAFIINALSGVSYEDLMFDYELSVFSEAGRSDYDDYEKMRMIIPGAFKSLYTFFTEYSQERNGEGNLKRGVALFLEDRGITAEELEKIKDILTEK